jgi:hypothetical protein
VQLVTDSLFTAHVVQNYKSRSPRILTKLRMLRNLREEHGVTLSKRHLPSVLNCWADRLSRRRDSLHWELPDISRRLIGLRVQRKLRVVDGHDLRDHAPLPNAVVLPRLALLGVWARHLAAAREGVMVTPHWPRQSWFSRATTRATIASAGSARLAEPNGSLAEHRVQLQYHAALRWSTQGQQADAPLLRDTLGSVQAAYLLGSTQAHSTQASYQTHWERFVRY